MEVVTKGVVVVVAVKVVTVEVEVVFNESCYIGLTISHALQWIKEHIRVIAMYKNFSWITWIEIGISEI